MKSRKHILAILFAFLLLTASTSCKTIVFPIHSKKVVHTNGKGELPPGQMKKMTGEKSAKKYAPGQQKK